MQFNSLYNRLIAESSSREERIELLKKDSVLLAPRPAVFRFSYVVWDHKDSIPYDKIEALRDTGLFNYEYDTCLGSDDYFVFFADFKLNDKICNILTTISCYEDDLKDVLEYDEEKDYYTSFVALEELTKMVNELE